MQSVRPFAFFAIRPTVTGFDGYWWFLMLKMLTLFACILSAAPAIAFESETRQDYIVLGETLESMKERPLPLILQDASSVFRFTYWMSWVAPMVVRIETFQDGRPALLTRIDGRNHSSRPPTRKKTSIRELTDAELASLRTAFNAVKICGSPLRLEEDAGGLDGSTWDFEFADAIHYCAARRWEPRAHDPFRGLGLLVLDLAKSLE